MHIIKWIWKKKGDDLNRNDSFHMTIRSCPTEKWFSQKILKPHHVHLSDCVVSRRQWKKREFVVFQWRFLRFNEGCGISMKVLIFQLNVLAYQLNVLVLYPFILDHEAQYFELNSFRLILKQVLLGISNWRYVIKKIISRTADSSIRFILINK